MMATAAGPPDTGHVDLLERNSAWASLAEYVADARSGHGRLVLINGEAGVGKSVLVEQLWQSLPDARRSWGACDGLFTPRPLGPLLDIAEDLGGELLDLVCEGCSNAEIATRLVLSVKTVDHHVSAVLAKLGAPTRQAAARTAARLGVAGS
jgi:DNA-binding CsgD family transcriptional regulator